MKATVLNGSRETDKLSNDVYNEVLQQLYNAGVDVRTFILRDLDIAYCAGCFGCWTKTPGLCGSDDAGREIAGASVNSDLLVLIGPLTFGCYSPLLKKVLERLTPTVSPFFTRIDGEVHHRKRYSRYPSLLAIAVAPDRDEEAKEIFGELVRRNALNLHSPSYTAGIVGVGGMEQVKAEIEELLTLAEVTK